MNRGIIATMRAAVGLLALAFSSYLAAQGIPNPKPPAEYRLHQTQGPLTVGAEYLGHSVFYDGVDVVVQKYVVVEVSIQPAKGADVSIHPGDFMLLINPPKHGDAKRGILPQPAGFVAAQLKYPDWGYDRRVEGEVDRAGAGVIINGPVGQPRFPGDERTAGRYPLPRTPGPPPMDGPKDTKPDRLPQATPLEAVTRAALPEGVVPGPLAGVLYFPYDKKLKSIKTLVLKYRGPEGELTFPLYTRSGH